MLFSYKFELLKVSIIADRLNSFWYTHQLNIIGDADQGDACAIATKLKSKDLTTRLSHFAFNHNTKHNWVCRHVAWRLVVFASLGFALIISLVKLLNSCFV